MLTLLDNDPSKAKKYFKAKATFTTGPMELDRLISEKNPDINIIDVREAEDFEKGHIPSAINKPRNSWNTSDGIMSDKVNIFYCYSDVCHLASDAALHFANLNYRVMELEGGFDCWSGYKLNIAI